jgi:hypothetical protein
MLDGFLDARVLLQGLWFRRRHLSGPREHKFFEHAPVRQVEHGPANLTPAGGPIQRDRSRCGKDDIERGTAVSCDRLSAGPLKEPRPEASAVKVRFDEEPSNEDDLALDAGVANKLHQHPRSGPCADGDVPHDGASDLDDPRAQRLRSGEEPNEALVPEVVGIAVARLHPGDQTRECLEVVGGSRSELH